MFSLFYVIVIGASVIVSAGLVTRVEHLASPLGLETRLPRFSWWLDAVAAAALPRASEQVAWHVQVATAPTAWSSSSSSSGGGFVWDSGVVASNTSSLVEYGGAAPLDFDGIYWWRVGVGYKGNESSSAAATAWSAPARFSIGPDGATLAAAASSSSSGARARFIGAASVHESACPWFRSPHFSFTPPGSSSSSFAVLATVGSVGFHELWVNGQKASADVLAPAVSDLAKRVLLRTYDVTALLRTAPGETNVMGLWLSRGWSDFRSVNPPVSNLFNSSAGSPIAIARLVLTTPGKTTVLMSTDGAWKAATSDTTHRGAWTNSDFGGDRVDTRLSQPLWSSASFDDSSWAHAQAMASAPAGRVLSNDVSEPNRLREAVPARSVTKMPPVLSGGWLVEMEQVFTGWVFLNGLKAKPGATVTIKASSVAICGTPAATAASAEGRPFCSKAPEYNMQHEVVVGSNGVLANWAPRFSYHEVHFLVIEGLSEAPPPSAIVGRRVGNIGTLSGADGRGGAAGRGVLSSFTSSDATLNRIYNVSLWTIANLVTGGISVDCPHRERLGYLGDAHTSFETALQNVESAPFYTKWLTDILDIQGYPAHTAHVDPDGYIAHTAPTIDGGGGPSWSGFVVTMPWQLYLAYGDARVLATALPAMRKLLAFWNRSLNATGDGLYHDWGVAANGSVVDKWSFLGDWVSPHGSEQAAPGTAASPEAELFNNCYILYCMRIIAAAEHLALPGAVPAAEVAALEAAAAALGAAIHAQWFIVKTSTYLDSRQTHLVMPLISGAVPPEHVAAVWASLRAEIVGRQAGHLDAGLQGTYFLTKLLYDTAVDDYVHGTTCGGHDDLIHMMTTVTSAPGYVDLLAKGFTTWPEAWGNCLSEHNPQQPYACAATGKWRSGSSSPAHGCLNGLGQWFVAGLGGIRRAAGRAGFQRFEIRPAIGVGKLRSASTSFNSPYGLIRSAWVVVASLEGSQGGGSGGQLNVTVPPNTRAAVYVPAAAAHVREGGMPAEESHGVRLVRARGAAETVYDVGSGDYAFSWS